MNYLPYVRFYKDYRFTTGAERVEMLGPPVEFSFKHLTATSTAQGAKPNAFAYRITLALHSNRIDSTLQNLVVTLQSALAVLFIPIYQRPTYIWARGFMFGMHPDLQTVLMNFPTQKPAGDYMPEPIYTITIEGTDLLPYHELNNTVPIYYTALQQPS